MRTSTYDQGEGLAAGRQGLLFGVSQNEPTPAALPVGVKG